MLAAAIPRSRSEPRAPRELLAERAPLVAAANSIALSPEREGGRKLVVRLVYLLLLLAIVEGAIRKWVAPQLGAYIFFLRDPILVLAYLVATRYRLWPRNSALFRLSVGLAVFGAVLLVLQVATGGYSEHRLVLGVYGWRAYFLYAPLAFLVGAQFGRTDVLRLSKLMLWLAIPIAVLVTAQFFSPQGAPINVGIAEDAEFQFKGLGLNAERTRPMGPFASGAAQQQFVVLACAILIAFFIAPRRLPQPSFAVLLLTGGGVLTCIALSGSRGTVLQCALAIAVAFGVGMVGRGAAIKGRAILWPAVLTLGALLAYPIVFPEGYSAFTERWTAADAAERQVFQETGVFGRAVYGLIDFVRLVDDVPMFGYGLGFGGNAAITLRATIDGVPIGGLAETDSARHIVDLGPLLGMGYIVFRLVVAAWLTRMAFRAVRRHADPMPLLLWSYVAYVFVMGQLTGQGTINFFGWLFAGVLIAACNPSGSRLLRRVGTLSPIRKFPHSTKGTP